MSAPRLTGGALRRSALRPFHIQSRTLRVPSRTATTARLPTAPSRTQLLCTSLLAFPLALSPPFRPGTSADSFSAQNSPLEDYKRSANTPIIRDDGRWNAKALRQVSAGSILGLVGGVVVSLFSKPLAVLIGLGVFGVQALESRGIHLVPYERIGKYFKSINLKGVMANNVAFKLAFGATFALAAFAEF